jgi:heme/copper-type cytochrome/quinol oxidase subunit 4
MHKTDGLLATLAYAFGFGIVIGLLAFLLFLFLEADRATTTHKEYQYEENLKGQQVYRKNTVMRNNFDGNTPAKAALWGFFIAFTAIFVLRYIPFLPSIEQLLDSWAGVTPPNSPK